MLGLDRLAREPELTYQTRGSRGRLRGLSPGEALDQARQAGGVAAADDPFEQSCMLFRDVDRRVPRCRPSRRMRESQQVAMRHTITLPVLHGLVRETLDRLRGIPVGDCAPQSAAPAAEPF